MFVQSSRVHRLFLHLFIKDNDTFISPQYRNSDQGQALFCAHPSSTWTLLFPTTKIHHIHPPAGYDERGALLAFLPLV